LFPEMYWTKQSRGTILSKQIKHMMQCINGILIMNYKKITKGQARKLFNAGKEIYLHTNKLSWNNQWQNPIPVNNADDKNRLSHHEWKVMNGYNYYRNERGTKIEEKFITTFDVTVNEYSYYNCDNERGNVVIYLISA
jgi:hypothetical protein